TTASVTVSPVVSTTYFVTVYDSFGCSNAVAEDILVTVYPSPSVTLGPDQTICLTDTINLTATPSGGTGPYTFAWSTGATTSTIPVSPEETTLYTVTVTDANGCTDADVLEVTVNSCIGL